MTLFIGFRKKRHEIRVNKLIEKLFEMEHEVTPWVIKNLKNYSSEELTEALKATYPELKSYMQKKILFHLDRIGYLGRVYENLKNGKEQEILSSLEILSLLRPIKALPLVLKRLADHRDMINLETVQVLIVYEEKKILEAMIKELRENSVYLPARIASVLQGYGSLAVDELLSNLDNPDLKTDLIIEILSQFEDDRVGKEIRSYLQNGDAKVRLAAVKFFAEQDNPDNADIFKEALVDSNLDVQAQAARGLENININI